MKVGDKVQRCNSSNEGMNIGNTGIITRFSDSTDCYIRRDRDGVECGSHGVENLKLITTNMNLKEKFALVFKGEPERSFIKAGVMNSDESLTPDGIELVMRFVLSKYKDDFKKEIVDPILAEDNKE